MVLDTRAASAIRLLWSKKPDAPVKSLAISDDGSWLVVSTYDDRLSAYDRAGKQLWSVAGTCKPTLIMRTGGTGRVLCEHDDDADAEVAFDVLDSNGNKLLSFPLAAGTDILSIKAASDGQSFAMSLTDGRVLFLDHEFRTLWQRKLGGELIDLDLVPRNSRLLSGRVGVLYRSRSRKEVRIAVFDGEGRKISETGAPQGGAQLLLTSDGRIAWIENVSKGTKFLGAFEIDSGLKRIWGKSQPFFADSRVAPFVEGTSMVAQENEETIAARNMNGQLEWKLSLSQAREVQNNGTPEAKSRIYLSAWATSAARASSSVSRSIGSQIREASNSSFLVLATDDGTVYYYRLTPR